MSRVLLVSSSGGHLDHLLALRAWWSQHERHWVTFDKADTKSVLGGEDVTFAYWPTTRNLVNLVKNFFVALRTLRSWRPDVIISSGAGVAVPFFLLAKVFKVKTVFVEVYDRIESPTLTGRICRPLADLFCVQWPSQQALYPGSVLIGELM